MGLFKSRRKKRVYVNLEKVFFTNNDWSTDHGYEYIDGFGITVDYGYSLHCLNGIDIYESKNVIDAIVKARNKKAKGLELEVGNKYILIPRWAYQDLINQIHRYVGYKERYWEV